MRKQRSRDGRTSGCRMSLLPNLETPRIASLRGPLRGRSAEQLDALLVMVPHNANAKLLSRLPGAQRWQELHARAKPRAGTVRTTALANSPANARRAGLSEEGCEHVRAACPGGPHAQGLERPQSCSDRSCKPRQEPEGARGIAGCDAGAGIRPSQLSLRETGGAPDPAHLAGRRSGN